MIYAFIGLKGSGKTTACNYLKTKLDGAEQVNFKDGLIAELKESFPDLLREIGEQMQEYVPIEKRGDVTNLLFIMKPPLVRTLMQNYGTEVRRKENPDYWVDKWLHSVCSKVTLVDGKIVTPILTDDVRFVEEYSAVKALGGTTIRIKRTDMVNTDSHQSETEQEKLQEDFLIECNGNDLERLYSELDKIVQNC